MWSVPFFIEVNYAPSLPIPGGKHSWTSVWPSNQFSRLFSQHTITEFTVQPKLQQYVHPLQHTNSSHQMGKAATKQLLDCTPKPRTPSWTEYCISCKKCQLHQWRFIPDDMLESQWTWGTLAAAPTSARQRNDMDVAPLLHLELYWCSSMLFVICVQFDAKTLWAQSVSRDNKPFDLSTVTPMSAPFSLEGFLWMQCSPVQQKPVFQRS